MRPLQSLANKLRSMLGLGIVKLINDSTGIQQLQVSVFDGEVRSSVNRYQNYGFSSCPRDGAQAVLASLGGNRGHLIALVVDDARYRPRGKQDGEVFMYHYAGDYIALLNGRNIHIECGGEVTVHAADRVTIDAPEAAFTGNVLIEGDLDLQGNATLRADADVAGTLTGDVVQDGGGVVLGTHPHTSSSPGSPTSPPIPG